MKAIMTKIYRLHLSKDLNSFSRQSKYNDHSQNGSQDITIYLVVDQDGEYTKTRVNVKLLFEVRSKIYRLIL